jgi:hypothetical protein
MHYSSSSTSYGTTRRTTNSHTSINRKLILLVFSFFLFVNIASSGGHLDVYDGTETFLITESMVLKHSAKLYPDLPSAERLHYDVASSISYHKATQAGTLPFGVCFSNCQITASDKNGIYIDRSLFLSAIAVPFYYVALLFSISPVVIVGLFVNSLLISLTSLIIFCFSFEAYGSKKIAFVLALIYGVCSFVWPYNTTLFPQPLQALTLITSAYFIYRLVHYNPFQICHYNRSRLTNSKGLYFAGLGGLFLGLSVFAHPTSALFIPGFIAYGIFSLRHYKKALVSFLTALSITSLFVGAINYARFGSFTSFGYGPQESLSAHNSLEGLVGLLTSPGAGLIFYFPVVILLPLAFIYIYRKNKPLFFLFAYIFVINWLYIGTINNIYPNTWTGVGAWGPRYLLPVLPFIVMPLGALLQHLKSKNRKEKRLAQFSIIILLCSLAFFVNSLGKLVWFDYGYAYGMSKERIPNFWNTITWNPFYSPILLHLRSLISDYIGTSGWMATSANWMSNGLAPCSYDTYLLCKLGIMPVIILLSISAIVAMLIINKSGRLSKYRQTEKKAS